MQGGDGSLTPPRPVSTALTVEVKLFQNATVGGFGVWVAGWLITTPHTGRSIE